MNLVAWHTARKMSERTALPDLDTLNHEALKALIVAQHAQILSKDEQLVSRDEEIERLKLLIAQLRRMQFGRKSEKLDRQIEHMEVKLEDLQADEGEAASETEEKKARKKPVRKPLPAHLPRDERFYPPAQEACPACGAELRHLVDDISEQLE